MVLPDVVMVVEYVDHAVVAPVVAPAVVEGAVAPGLETHWSEDAQYCQLAQQIEPQAISPEPSTGVHVPLPAPTPVDWPQ